ncbi:MAG: alcohol dehydrogenase catalytic domain-containing protein [Marinoscillum sp.]
MQQLFFVKKGKLEWREVPAPRISSGNDALVRPFAVAKCDLDDAFLFNNVDLKIRIGNALGLIDPSYKSTFGNLLKGPFPFGHECVAQVIETGSHVSDVKIGDIVSVPFQISCGFCDNCRRGYTATCNTVSSISTYGFGKHLEFGGAMSDVIKVPYADHMLTKIPDSIDPIKLASLSDNISDAYRHIGGLEQNPDQSILIISGKAKSVGIYALILAKSLGAREVDFVDNNEERLELAQNLNATITYSSFSQLNKKYDLVIDASSTQKGLNAAFKSVRNYGTVSSSGIYIQKTAISLIDLYAKGVKFKIGLANAKTDAPKVLELINAHHIDFGLATTRLDTWNNAIDAFLTDTTKVIVTREKV